MGHIPVLLKESLDILCLKQGSIYLDATLGAGGHAKEVLRRFPSGVEVAGIDVDPQAVEMAKLNLSLEDSPKQVKFAVLNFRRIKEAPEILGIARPTAILFDLGWNKHQFESGGRGFSFNVDEPLNMSYGGEGDFNAYDVVNSWSPENLETIISAYGEERFSKRIVARIVERRGEKPIKTSKELAEIVKFSVPVWSRFKKIHPATKTFQAIRMAVNDELQALEAGMKGALEILEVGGRMAAISFHSLEDRIVKRFFKSVSDSLQATILTPKPIIAGEEELKDNPRSRSAKLRAIEKINK